MLIVFFFLLSFSCKKEKLERSFRRVNEISFRVTSKNVPVINARVALINVKRIEPYYQRDGYYYFKCNEGVYRLEIEKECHVYYTSSVEIVDRDGHRYIKGTVEVDLLKEDVVSTKIFSSGIGSLHLKGEDRDLHVESKDNYFTFTSNDIGEYICYYGNIEHKIKISILKKKVSFYLNNNLIDKIPWSNVTIYLKVSDHIRRLYLEGIIGIGIEYFLPPKSTIEILEETLFEDDFFVYNSSYLNVSKSFELKFNFNIGSFNFSNMIYFDVYNSNKIERFYHITEKYHVVDLDGFNLSSSILYRGEIKHFKYSNGVRLHLLGDGKEIDVKLPYSVTKTVKLDIDGYGKVNFNEQLLEKELSVVKSELGLHILNKKLEGTLLLCFRHSNRYYIFKKLEDIKDLFFLPEGFEGFSLRNEYYGLFIKKDEDNNIIYQDLFYLRKKYNTYRIPFLDKYKFEVSKCFGGHFCLDGRIYVNLNDRLVNNILRDVKFLDDRVTNLIFSFKISEYNSYGANIDIVKSRDNKNNGKGEYKLNFQKDILIDSLGEYVTLDIFGCDKDVSAIGKENLTISLSIYMVSGIEDVDVKEMKLNEKGIEDNFFALSEYSALLFNKSFSVFPIISSQTFNFRLSYSKDDVLDSEGHYSSFLTDVKGRKEFVFSSENIKDSSDYGESPSQNICKKSNFNASSIIAGVVGMIFSKSILDAICPTLNIVLGTTDFLSSPKYVSSNVLNNFKSKNREIKSIPNSNDLSYMFEWRMYVYIQKDENIVFDSPKIYGNVDIEIKLSLKKGSVNLIEKRFGRSRDSVQIDVDEGWYTFNLKINKIGRVTSSWGIDFTVPFEIYRDRCTPLDEVSSSMFKVFK